jgi:Ca2+:H+ antiporter
MPSLKPSLNWLLVFIPIALLLERVPGAGDPLVFFAAALSIVPIARLIGQSTHQLAHYTGDAIGGLLNATFGNLPELIIAVVALRAGLYEMVAASLIGVLLANLLLATGFAFLLGGLRHHTQEFNPGALSVYGSMMFISVISLALPSLYERVFARLLLVLYVLYLVFMLRTHPDQFASVAAHEESHDEDAQWSVARCMISLVAASLAAAWMSELLVGSAEGTGHALGLSAPFIGIVLLATVGGAAESASAVSMGMRNRLDLTLGIVFGSCIQIALFIAPALVFASYFVGPKPFQLSFSTGGVGLMFVAVLIATLVAGRGSSNWYKGVQLLAVYGMIAMMLYLAPI